MIDALYNSELKPPLIERVVFEELLDKATQKVQFSFNGTMYEQIDGVAMGSPLGPVLANIFVGIQEERLFTRTSKPSLYYRYVDDTFAIFDSRDEAVNFLSELNGLHPSLQFTHEDEVNKQLPFLDVLVERRDDSFVTSVYRKPTFTGEYVPWGSFCPVRRKVNLVACLANRAIRICSQSKLKQELDNISKLFSKLGYPEPIIRNTIKQVVTKSTLPPPSVESDKSIVRIRLPYIGPVSHRFDKQLTSTVQSTFPSVKVQVAFVTQVPFRGFTKDSSPTPEKNNTIYRFKCHCESDYVGKSTQRLHKRINQHVPKQLREWMVNTANKPPDVNKISSAIGRHLISNPECADHYKDSMFTIVTRARNSFQLDVLESLYIELNQPPLCKQKFLAYKTMLFKHLGTLM